MPFAKTDAYVQKDLADYYGEDICEFDNEFGYLGCDGWRIFCMIDTERGL